MFYFVLLFVFFPPPFAFVYRPTRSQKVTSSYNDSAMVSSKIIPPPTASGPDHPLNKNPRKSWSSIAYNNKNFPDGKLGYEHQHVVAGSNPGQRSSMSSATTANHNASTSNTTTGNKLLSKGFSKFERSGQDVMARASQIVQ